MRALLRFSRGIDNFSDRLGWIAMILVIAVVAIGFYNVVSRYLGYYLGVRLSSNFWIELQWYLYSLIFFLGFPYNLRHGINVRVDFIYSFFSGTVDQSAYCEILETDKLSIRTPNPVSYHIDGEPCGETDTFSIELLPASLKMLVPKHTLKP